MNLSARDLSRALPSWSPPPALALLSWPVLKEGTWTVRIFNFSGKCPLIRSTQSRVTQFKPEQREVPSLTSPDVPRLTHSVSCLYPHSAILLLSALAKATRLQSESELSTTEEPWVTGHHSTLTVSLSTKVL